MVIATGDTGIDIAIVADNVMAVAFGVGLTVLADEAAFFFFSAQSFCWLLQLLWSA